MLQAQMLVSNNVEPFNLDPSLKSVAASNEYESLPGNEFNLSHKNAVAQTRL